MLHPFVYFPLYSFIHSFIDSFLSFLIHHRYDVIIATTAVDSKSAMATYICTKAGETCTVNTALVYDPSGTGLNTVTIHTASGTISELRALIVGYGDGKQMNSFQLGAQLKPK